MNNQPFLNPDISSIGPVKRTPVVKSERHSDETHKADSNFKDSMRDVEKSTHEKRVEPSSKEKTDTEKSEPVSPTKKVDKKTEAKETETKETETKEAETKEAETKEAETKKTNDNTEAPTKTREPSVLEVGKKALQQPISALLPVQTDVVDATEKLSPIILHAPSKNATVTLTESSTEDTLAEVSTDVSTEEAPVDVIIKEAPVVIPTVTPSISSESEETQEPVSPVQNVELLTKQKTAIDTVSTEIEHEVVVNLEDELAVDQAVVPAIVVENKVLLTAKVTELAKAVSAQIPSVVKLVEQLSIENTLKNQLTSTSSIAENDMFSTLAEGLTSRQVVSSEAVQHTSTATTPLSSTAQSASNNNLQLSVNTPFKNTAQWGEAVTDRVMWMSSKGVKQADIQLDPPELGPITVKVSVVQEQAQVSFTVHNAGVRDALDQNMLRLREMFEEDGLNLVNVNVSDQESSNEEDTSSDEGASLLDNNNSDSSGDEVIAEVPIRSHEGGYSIIDSYV